MEEGTDALPTPPTPDQTPRRGRRRSHRARGFGGALTIVIAVGVALAAGTSAAGAQPALHGESTAVRATTTTPLASTLSCSVQTSSLRLCRARTDNYKDCYNAPDGARELRTWLAFSHVNAGGASYRVSAGQGRFQRSLAVTRIAGSTSMPSRAFLTAKAYDGPWATMQLRNDSSPALWGPLLRIDGVAALRAEPVRVSIALWRTDGTHLAHVAVSYRYDTSLATAPSSSPEHNGPGGRWHVSGLRTATDVELGVDHRC